MDIKLGTKLGKITILEYFPGSRISGRGKLLVKCDCGSTKLVRENEFLKGRHTSCGCIRKARASTLKGRHFKRYTPEYEAWKAIKRRCYNKKLQGYKNYGGRGIIVCARWLNSPEAFMEDMGPRPKGGYSIDRIDNNGNYEPKNCRWATRLEQAHNKRQQAPRSALTAFGKTQSVPEWSQELNIKQVTIHTRLSRGWSPERALTSDTRKGIRKK